MLDIQPVRRLHQHSQAPYTNLKAPVRQSHTPYTPIFKPHQFIDLEELRMAGQSSSVSTSISLEELEAQITELAGQLNAANYRWLTLIAEFDRRQGWADGSLHSCAHWLNFKVGLNMGAAREKVRVAHALAGVPKSTPPPMPRATFPRK